MINKGSYPKNNVSIAWREETIYDRETKLAAMALGEVLIPIMN